MDAIPTVETVKERLEKFYAKKGISPPFSLFNGTSNKVINLDCYLHLMAGWEQCLDIKTGEIYQRTGIKIDNQPRRSPERSYYLWKRSDDHSDNSSVDAESGHNTKIIRENNGKPSASATLPPSPTSLGVVVCNGCLKNMITAAETRLIPGAAKPWFTSPTKGASK